MSPSRTCNRVAEQSPYCTPATRTCTDALPYATSGDLMRVRRQSQFVGHKAWFPGTSQIEPSCERATTAWDGAQEIGLVPASTRARGLGGRSRDLLSLDLENGWKAAHRARCRRGSGRARDGAHCGKRRGRRGRYGLRVAVVRCRGWRVVRLRIGGTSFAVAPGGRVGRVGRVRVRRSQRCEGR